MVRVISGKGSERGVQSLKLRLLAVVSGVTVTVACAGSSGGADSGDAGRGGDTGSGGSMPSVAGAGMGGTTGNGTSGAGGSAIQSGGSSGTGASAGSSAGMGGAAPKAGAGGTAQSAGTGAASGGVGASGGMGGVAPSGGATGGTAPSAGMGGRSPSAGAAGAGTGGAAGSAPLGGAGGMGGRTVSTAGQTGRPFLVAGENRVSGACARGEWREPSLAASPALEALDEAARGLIAEYFTQAALLEHASIAAFARFSLELVALGAPPELLAATTEAMVDETRHARLCFELASRYAGRDIGPGRLDVTGALGVVELANVVDHALLEGCIGETAAALEARFAAESATDPVVQSVLAAVAEDEERHAALAFRFVAWAVEREPRLLGVLRARVTALAAAEPRVDDTSRLEPFAAELSAHGVPSPAERRAARAAALDDVVPALLAALERKASQRANALAIDDSEEGHAAADDARIGSGL